VTYKDKIHALTDHFQDLFRLNHWDVYVRTLPSELMQDGADGYYHAQHSYLVAKIDIAEDLDDERLVRVVAHEMAHVLLSPLDSAVASTIQLLPEKMRERESIAYNHAEEQVIQMLSGGLSQLASIINQLKEEPTAQETTEEPCN
jgi:Zn-dependent peptidase ImmA (M78 family)